MNNIFFHSCPILQNEFLNLYLKLGSTEMICVYKDSSGGGIYAKCEWSNPFGTIKDRAAFWMIVDALSHFKDATDAKENAHILEYSGGSLGFSVANFCQLLGIKNTLVLGSWIPEADLIKIRLLGPNIILCPKEKGFLEVIAEAKRISKNHPEWSFLYQHENKACLRAHEIGTALEVQLQIKNQRIDAWVAAVGTGATLIGVGEVLRNKNSNISIHAVSPQEQPYGTQEAPNALRKIVGSGGLGNGLLQSFIENSTLTVAHHSISYDEAVSMMIELKESFGLKVGSSSAANFKVAREIYSTLGEGSVVVTVFPSIGTDSEWEYAKAYSISNNKSLNIKHEDNYESTFDHR